MNRQQRRSQAATSRKVPELSEALKSLKGLQDFNTLAESVQPHLQQLTMLGSELQTARLQLAALTLENKRQREVMLRLLSMLTNYSYEALQAMIEKIAEDLEGSDGI